MNSHTYRTLFEDFADYRTPDGTLVQAIWTGNEPGANPRASHYWILAPELQSTTPITEFWQYEVEPSGDIIVRYIIKPRESDLPGQMKEDLLTLFDKLSFGIIELGMTDLTVADFTKVENI